MQPLSVSSNIDSLDMAKNPATDSMAHVHQMNLSGAQDGAVLQHAWNVDSDIQNMMMVSLHCSVIDSLVHQHISALSHPYHHHYSRLSSPLSCLIDHHSKVKFIVVVPVISLMSWQRILELVSLMIVWTRRRTPQLILWLMFITQIHSVYRTELYYSMQGTSVVIFKTRTW